MIILTDSREQKPYSFETPSEVGTLKCGDYSLVGGEHLIGVERKTLDDLIGCLSKDRARFERELFKGKSLDYMALVIEGSLSDIIGHKYRSQMEPKAVIQSLIAFSIRYHLPVWFAGSREHGQRITASLLEKYAREVEKKHEALSKVAVASKE